LTACYWVVLNIGYTIQLCFVMFMFPRVFKEEIKKNGYKVSNLRDWRRQIPFKSVPVLTAGFCNVKQLATLLLSLDGMPVHHSSFILVNTSTVEPSLTATSIQQQPFYNSHFFLVPTHSPYSHSYFNLSTIAMVTKACPKCQNNLSPMAN